MSRNPETIIQQEIINYLKDRRIFHFRVNADINTVGIPDLIVCYRGYFIGLEVKTKKGKISKLQLEVAKEISNNGGFVCFPTSVEDVKNLINKIDEESDK